VNVVINPRVPQKTGKFLSSCITDGLLGSTQLHKVN
jgi:hypothetical protein